MVALRNLWPSGSGASESRNVRALQYENRAA